MKINQNNQILIFEDELQKMSKAIKLANEKFLLLIPYSHVHTNFYFYNVLFIKNYFQLS